MDMTGSVRIAATRDTVWQALNDAEVLARCIPGCETLEREGDDAFVAKVRAKIGPISAKFSGKVTLRDIDPGRAYTLVGEGNGGVAGFAKGEARVSLSDDDDDGTLLAYTAKAQVGGKLAQLGARLVDAAAAKISDDFFAKFGAEFAAPVPDAEPGTE